jgi:hypothetical protein
MIYCAFKTAVTIITLLGLLMTATTSSSCSEMIDSKQHTIQIELTPTQKQPLFVSTWQMEGESGTETNCSASISVPVSAFPSVRLVARPADFASDLREKLDEWDDEKCSVVVWLNNDTGDELENEETCLVETFRYDGDSVWSASSEESCYPDYAA